MIFYPKCTASPTRLDASFNQDFSIQWSISPTVERLILKNYKLQIPKYHLYTALSDLKSGFIIIKLQVYSINQGNITSYTVQA